METQSIIHQPSSEAVVMPRRHLGFITIVVITLLSLEQHHAGDLRLKRGIGFYFQAETSLIRQHTYYQKPINLNSVFTAISQMWDRNFETKSLLDQFLAQYVSSMNFETNWFAPPLFELGSRVPMNYHEAIRLCQNRNQHLPELDTWDTASKFRDLMDSEEITDGVFAGIYQDMTDMTKRFITTGHPFNTGWLTRDIEVYELSGKHTFWDEHNDMELHDDVDYVATYDQDATMIFQPAHPKYQTNHYSRWGTFAPELAKSLTSKGRNLDLWAFNAPVICQNSGISQTKPPQVSPTEKFNSHLLTAAVATARDTAVAGMNDAHRAMINTDDLLTQAGITLKNLDVWFAATDKTRAVQQLYLEFPEASSSGRYTRREKPRPATDELPRRKKRVLPLNQVTQSPNPRYEYPATADQSNITLARSERMIFQIMSGITLGAIRFKRERDLNQRLDQMAGQQQENTVSLGELQLNQKELIHQGQVQFQMIEKFKEAMLRWAQSFADRINPVLEVQTINDRAILINSGTMQEVHRAHVRLESFIQAAMKGHVNANILSTSEFDKLALTIQDLTALRAVHNPSQIPCAMMAHSDNQTIQMHFAIPLTEAEPYSLVQMLPIKVFQDGQSVIPRIQHQYAALASNEFHYHPLTEAEYRKCLLGPCTFDAVASTPLADHCGFEQYFGINPPPCEGIVLPEIPRDTYQTLGDQGTIFSIVKEALATISCPKSVQPSVPSIILTGTGILQVPPLCTALIVGTPPHNSVRIRGPEATVVIRKKDIETMFTQSTLQATKLALQSTFQYPEKEPAWKESLLGSTKELTQHMVQQISSKTTLLAKTFHAAYNLKTNFNQWLSTAGIIAISCCMIFALIASLYIGFRWKSFKARLHSKIGNLTTTLEGSVAAVRNSTRTDLAHYNRSVRELKTRLAPSWRAPSPAPLAGQEEIQLRDARIQVHDDSPTSSDNSSEIEAFIAPQ